MFFILMSKRTDDDEWEPLYETKYSTPQAANEEAKLRNERSIFYEWTVRYKIRKVVDTDDDNFYAREAAFNHKPIPWEDSSQRYGWPWRLPHIDPNNERNVRYFRDIEDAIIGKYTTIAMSRYLANYEDYDDEETAEILVKAGYYQGSEFGITNDPDKIIDVYNNGPSSCMNDPDEYELPDPHPAIVYSEGDFALAYMGKEGAYSARAIVCQPNKTYYNIYGHEALLEKHLKEAGYTYSSSNYDGMRVKAISHAGSYLMPYIDFTEYGKLSDCGEFIVLSNDYESPFCIRTTCGYVEEE